MQKGSAALFLLIAIFLAVGLIGVFFLGLFKTGSIQIPIKVLASPAKYLVYANQNLNFEFHYPTSNFTVKEDSEAEYNQRAAGSASKSVNGDYRKNFKGYVGYEPG